MTYTICTKLMKITFVLYLLVNISTSYAAGEVYQWTDTRGVTHFTDNLQSVPETLRDSSDLIVRRDLPKGPSFRPSNRPAAAYDEPVAGPQLVKDPGQSRPEPEKTGPTIIYNPQNITQITNIVVVRPTVVHVRRRPSGFPLKSKQKPRRDFEDRRFIHPSVFTGHPGPHIRPSVHSR